MSPAPEPPPLTLVPTEAELGPAMARSLTALLDRVTGARDVLPHLAALEDGLRRHGAAAVELVPPHGLARMTSQLTALPADAADAALMTLRTRLAVAWERVRNPPPEPTPTAPGNAGQFLSTFINETKVEVCEVSHSAFLAALDAQRTSQPQPPR
jgi:hypothetical protein